MIIIITVLRVELKDFCKNTVGLVTFLCSLGQNLIIFDLFVLCQPYKYVYFHCVAYKKYTLSYANYFLIGSIVL